MRLAVLILVDRIANNSSHSRNTGLTDSAGESAIFLIEFEPRASLSKFLETDPEFVNEVAPRLCGLNLTVIRERRRAAASQLECDVLPEWCTGQAISQLARGGSETHQPVL